MKRKLEKNKIWGAFLSYSFLFLLLGFFIFLIFDKSNNYFFLNEEWINSSYINIIYFRRLILSFLETGELNFFTYNIGLGYDLFLNFISMIGDFFSYFSILVSEKDVLSFYQVFLFIRLYFVGISFIVYSKYKKISNHSSVVGAIIYTFSIFSLYYLINNPYILNIMFLLPLFMIGIEKIVNDNKKIYFIFISFLISFTNIYFIPIIFIYLLFYSGILIVLKYKDYGFKLVLMALFRVVLSYFIGVILTGVLFVPVFCQIHNLSIDLFNDYSVVYLKDLFIPYLVNSFDNIFIGINSIFLLYFPLCLKKYKENKNMIILLILVVLFLIVFSNFNYINYLGFIPLFIISLLLSKTIDLYVNISKSDFKWIISFILINIILVMCFGSDISNFLFILIITFILLLILLNRKELFNLISKFDIYPYIFNIIFVISVILTIYSFYKFEKNDIDLDKYLSSNGYEISSFSTALESINDNDFYRISKDSNKLSNISLYYDFNTNNGIYLYEDNNYKELSNDLGNFSYTNSFGNFNNRTKINGLLNNKYYLANNVYYVPNGYSLFNEVNDTKVYLNNDFISFVSFYNQYISLEDYNSLNALEKEDSLLKYVVLENVDNKYVSKNDNFKDSISKNIHIINYSSDMSKEKINLYIEDNDYKGELYLKINDFKASDVLNIGVSHRDVVYNKEVIDEDEILVNLSGYDKIEGAIEISFSNIDYSFSNIELYVVGFNDFENEIAKLNSSNFEVIDISNNYIKGNVNSSNAGVLQFSVGYNDNFKVLVDGKSIDTLKVNKYFLGIYLDSGEHIIEIEYKSPGKIGGYCLSVTGLVLYIVIFFLELKNNKKTILK